MKPTHIAPSSKASKAAQTNEQDVAFEKLIDTFVANQKLESSSWAFSILRYGVLLLSSLHLTRVDDLNYDFDLSIPRFAKFLFHFADVDGDESERRSALITLLTHDIDFAFLREIVINAYSITLRASLRKSEQIAADDVSSLLLPSCADSSFFEFLAQLESLQKAYRKYA